MITIMNDKLMPLSNALQKMNWDSPNLSDIPEDGQPSAHMAQIVKDLSKLHRTLISFLGPESTRQLFQTIFKNSVKQLEDDFKKVDIFSIGGKNRYVLFLVYLLKLMVSSMLTDVQYFNHTLSSLEGVDGPGSSLEVVVNNIKIKDKRFMGFGTATEAKSATTAMPSSPSSTEAAGTGMFAGFRFSTSTRPEPSKQGTDFKKNFMGSFFKKS